MYAIRSYYGFGKQSVLFEEGVIRGHDFETVEPFDAGKITEEASRSWYENGASLSPYEGETQPYYTDLNPDGTLKTEGKYSWLKAPRYGGEVMEVGPLARMIVGVAKNSPVIVITSYSIHYTKVYDLCASHRYWC